MKSPKASNITLDRLKRHGFVAAHSADLPAALEQGNLVIYAGFDATATSLHIGHLKILNLLRLLASHKNTVLIVLGGGTSFIGDPSGRSSTRTLLSESNVSANIASLEHQIKHLMRDVSAHVEVLNNYDWLAHQDYIHFMRTVGQHVSVGRLLGLDTMRNRLDHGQPLSFLEFSYPLVQAYDFLHLYQEKNCTLQVGGADQWGNITIGQNLIHKITGASVYGLTCPLLTNTDGQKMGKTAQGAVWLDENLLSAYDFWQFWRNIDDSIIQSSFLSLTTLTPDEVDEMMSSHDNANDHKKMLASLLCTWVHDNAKSQKARHDAQQIFEDQQAHAAERCEIAFDTDSISLLDVMVKIGHCESKSHAKRILEQGGCYVDQKKIHDKHLCFNQECSLHIQTGKKRHTLVHLKRSV